MPFIARTALIAAHCRSLQDFLNPDQVPCPAYLTHINFRWGYPGRYLSYQKKSENGNAENLTKVVNATGISADEAKVKTLIAALQGVDIAAELANASAIAAAPAQSAPAAAKEEKKEEKAEEAAEGLSALFG